MKGKPVPWKEATIHVASHVVHYGSSLFEGFRAYETPKGTAVFRLKDHTRRLDNSFKIYRTEFFACLNGEREDRYHWLTSLGNSI